MQDSIDYITIKGFRSIRSIEKLPIKPVNLLIGPNGSGKSNFIKAFELLAELRKGGLAKYTVKRGGADKIVWFGSKNTQQMQVEVSFDNESKGYRTCISISDDD